MRGVTETTPVPKSEMPPKLNLPTPETSAVTRHRQSLPVFTTRYAFPSTQLLGDSMYLGAGADLEADTLLYAYSHGFFPWYEKAPILARGDRLTAHELFSRKIFMAPRGAS